MEGNQTAVEKKCKVEGCKRPYRAKGYCNVHYKNWRRGEMDKKPRYKICGEENCRAPMFRLGYCEKHYEAWRASKRGEDKGPTEVSAGEVTPAPAVGATAEAPAATAEAPAATTEAPAATAEAPAATTEAPAAPAAEAPTEEKKEVKVGE